jgi:hypothetical protein
MTKRRRLNTWTSWCGAFRKEIPYEIWEYNIVVFIDFPSVTWNGITDKYHIVCPEDWLSLKLVNSAFNSIVEKCDMFRLYKTAILLKSYGKISLNQLPSLQFLDSHPQLARDLLSCSLEEYHFKWLDLAASDTTVDYFIQFMKYVRWDIETATKIIYRNEKLMALIGNIQTVMSMVKHKHTTETCLILNKQPFLDCLNYDKSVGFRFPKKFIDMSAEKEVEEQDLELRYNTSFYLFKKCAQDETFMRHAITSNIRLISRSPYTMRDDPDLIIHLLKEESMLQHLVTVSSVFTSASNRLRSDKNFVLRTIHFIRYVATWYACLSETLRHDREVVLAAIKRQYHSDIDIPIDFPDHLWADKKLLIEAIEYAPHLLQFLPHEFQDIQIVTRAIKTCPNSIEYVAPHFKTSDILSIHRESLIQKLIEQAQKARFQYDNDIEYEDLEERYQSDRVIIRALVASQPLLYHKLPYELANDKDIVIASFSKRVGGGLDYPIELFSDRDVVSAAGKSGFWGFVDGVKFDTAFVMDVFKNFNKLNDVERWLELFISNGVNLQDRETIKNIVKMHPEMISKFSDLRNDKEIVAVATQSLHAAKIFSLLPNHLQGNAEILTNIVSLSSVAHNEILDHSLAG